MSYANVMATLAFFFALSGGAMAAVKYLVATDTIPATSDLAGSTYGNPIIAAGKITSGKIADGAITSSKFDSSATAPNATELAGHPFSDLPLVVHRGSVTVTHGIGSTLDDGRCLQAGGGVVPGAVAGDIPLAGSSEAVTVDAYLNRSFNPSSPGEVISLVICNQSGFTMDVAGDYPYLVIR